jgi:2'-deoxynucleoside 5'-phosphate N-hydrolase
MKIYISGSIYGGREKIEVYKILIEHLEKYGEVFDKQIAQEETIENENFQSDEDIFLGLEKDLKSVDILFAEVTVPSLGVGYELGFADLLNKKIIAIYDETITKKVSTMIRGNKRIKLIPYKNIDEIILNLDTIINEK